MRLNNVFLESGLDPCDVSLVFHTTRLQPLRRMLPWMVNQRPDLFEAYQSVHSTPAEKTLSGRRYFASFVPIGEREMLLAGVFEILSSKVGLPQDIYADPRFSELGIAFGASDTAPEANITRNRTQIVFDNKLTRFLDNLRGRLVVDAPKGRAYIRLAKNLDPEIRALFVESQFEPIMPDWRSLALTAPEIRSIPESWSRRLADWRGVYLIVDQSDGARYVGAAYGKENLLGRWRQHVKNETGITKELAKRETSGFRFSILERVSPDAFPEDVIALERSWMLRLDTIKNGLNS